VAGTVHARSAAASRERASPCWLLAEAYAALNDVRGTQQTDPSRGPSANCRAAQFATRRHQWDAFTPRPRLCRRPRTNLRMRPEGIARDHSQEGKVSEAQEATAMQIPRFTALRSATPADQAL